MPGRGAPYMGGPEGGPMPGLGGPVGTGGMPGRVGAPIGGGPLII